MGTCGDADGRDDSLQRAALMDPIRVPTMWRLATDSQAAAFDEWICPRCSAMNRPGVSYVTLNEQGRYECSVCSHDWAKP